MLCDSYNWVDLSLVFVQHKTKQKPDANWMKLKNIHTVFRLRKCVE